MPGVMRAPPGGLRRSGQGNIPHDVWDIVWDKVASRFGSPVWGGLVAMSFLVDHESSWQT